LGNEHHGYSVSFAMQILLWLPFEFHRPANPNLIQRGNEENTIASVAHPPRNPDRQGILVEQCPAAVSKSVKSRSKIVDQIERLLLRGSQPANPDS
jgi:hypothetical protein